MPGGQSPLDDRREAPGYPPRSARTPIRRSPIRPPRCRLRTSAAPAAAPAASGRSCSRPRPGSRACRSSMPSSARTSATSRACASLSGWAMSRTCRMRSASVTSSSVARNAATSMVGRSATKPTVSERIAERALGQARCGEASDRGSRTGGRSAKTCGAGQRVEQGRLAGIGVADQRDHRQRRLLPSLALQAPARRDGGELAA